MPYEGAMQAAYEQLTDEEQIAVYQFVQFLLNHPPIQITVRMEKPVRKIGLLADRFQSISEDHHEPMTS